jgi:hypothetical protein
MSLWLRILLTFCISVLSSFVVGLFWDWTFGTAIPSYLSGVVGGLTALPMWEFLKRVGSKKEQSDGIR